MSSSPGIHREEPIPILYLKFLPIDCKDFFLRIDPLYFIKGNSKKVNVKKSWFKTFNFEHKHPGEVNF